MPQGHPSRGKPRICASIEEIPPGKSYDLPARGGGRQSPCGAQRSAPSRCQIANSIPIPSASPTAATHDGGNAHDQTSAPSDLSAVATQREFECTSRSVQAGAVCAVRWRGARIFKQVTSMRIVPRMPLGPRQHYVAETALDGGSGSIGMDARAQVACHATPREVKSARYS